jgi:MarR family transcriptional regulator, organic hydroperoxide resistance regulator
VDCLSHLQEEIKQNRPFRSTGQEAFLALLRTTDQLRRGLTRLVEPHGITLQQYNVLRILRGSHPEGLPTLEIANRMIEETPGITRLIDRLEERGYVQRERSISDRRQVFCRITEDGASLVTALDGPIDHWLVELLPLPAPELHNLIQLLEKLRSEHKKAFTAVMSHQQVNSAGN